MQYTLHILRTNTMNIHDNEVIDDKLITDTEVDRIHQFCNKSIPYMCTTLITLLGLNTTRTYHCSRNYAIV